MVGPGWSVGLTLSGEVGEMERHIDVHAVNLYPLSDSQIIKGDGL